ncbi:MAG: T9SS type A sorting domain-containing protein [Candidatus Eisenbacteria sp.]|nr:T9SS type A sorting domain-containing protein [Candidatus Eisenbacteria bacterium]
MRQGLLLLTVMVALVVPASTLADWNPEQPYKWVQYPDLSPMGIDVNASTDAAGEGYILADDFECTLPGPLTGIHIWASWLHDYLPGGGNPRNVTFTLSIHRDIPASQSPTGYSMPGELLWSRTFQPSEFTVQVWQSEIVEGWMDPPESYEFPADWTCWQYNFFIDPLEAFYQMGTPDNPMVYWLDMQASPGDPEAKLGWKTSLDHWNDNAVWGQGMEPYMGPWYELIYPPGHEMQGQPIDLAFVMVGEHQPQDLDFGDAPDGAAAPGYPTLLINNGANHIIWGPWLGDDNDAPDAEPDGQPTLDAKGDDNDGNDDEDGVLMPTLVQGQFSTIIVEINGGGGVLEVWIDFDGSQSWEASEQVFAGSLLDGTHSFNVATPVTSIVGQTFARFRITTYGGLQPDGPADDGEVEDYEVWIEAPPEEWDFGDAPDFIGGPNYPTLLVSNGARHMIGGPFFDDVSGVGGDSPDPELDGQPDSNALGDDNDGSDDEDGVQIPVLVEGQTGEINVTVGGGGGVVEAWIDFNGDYIWQGVEQIFAGWLPDGNHTIAVTTPVGVVVGQTFARFRISTAGGLTPVDAAWDGEVEDHEVRIEEQQAYKWLQRPDLSIMGIDVNATQPYILADDFLCTEAGYITDVFVWASWRYDYLPFGEDPEAVTFTLSFHKDIPDSMSPTQYSMPGNVEWFRMFGPGDFTAQIWQDDIQEGWMTPPEEYFFPGDTVCWLYKFEIPQPEAFRQEGTEDRPQVYWLDVQAEPHDQEAFFGWKTSLEHWNDDAVWGHGVEPYMGPWYELIYPPGHEMQGQSIDLAFMLRGIPVTDVGEETSTPRSFGLEQNVPNPFNPVTEIRYQIPASSRVSLEVFDVAGRLVCTLVDEVRQAGLHAAVWNGRDTNGRDVPSGVYFYRLRTDGLEDTRKMLLLK